MMLFKEMLDCKSRWQPIGVKVAFQFDGICDGHLKNPSSNQIKFFLEKTRMLGLEPIDIGHKQELSYCIDTMAKANCLVSCPSGMAVIARSINVPVCIVYNNLSVENVNSLKELQYKSNRIWWFKNFEEMFVFWNQISNPNPPINIGISLNRLACEITNRQTYRKLIPLL